MPDNPNPKQAPDTPEKKPWQPGGQTDKDKKPQPPVMPASDHDDAISGNEA